MKRLTWIGGGVVVAILCAMGHSLAAMPDYQVEQYCKRVAAVGGAFSESTYGACLHMEQSAYNNLKPKWDALPASMRTYCDRVAMVGGDGSYSTLEACVQMENDAAKENGEFKF